MFVRQQKNNEDDLHSHVSQQKFDFVENANDEQQSYQHSQHVQLMQRKRKQQYVIQSQKNVARKTQKKTHRRREFQFTSSQLRRTTCENKRRRI